MANSWNIACYWRGALRGEIGVYMRAVWYQERIAHARGSQRNALGEHCTPEQAAQVTVTISSLEVQWPVHGTVHATGGGTKGWEWGVIACSVVS